MFSLLFLPVFLNPEEATPPENGASAREFLDAWANQPIEEPGFTQVVIALFVVLLMIFAAAWLLRRLSFRNGRKLGRGGLKVLESLPLGGKRMIQVVRVHDRNLVVGVTGERIDLLTELSEEEVEAESAPEEKADRGFGNILPFQKKNRVSGRGKVKNVEG
jgi:flagellar protein FliO/FliZ